MKKFLYLLISCLILTACKKKDNPAQIQTTFPFVKVGNQWNYKVTTPSGETEISQRITAKNNDNFFNIKLSFVGTQLPEVDAFWYADHDSFAKETEWPESKFKFVMLKKNADVGDEWDYFVPAPLDPSESDIFGIIKYKILEKNASLSILGKTYNDVYKINHTASSHDGYYMNYYLSLSTGILKIEGMAIQSIDGQISYHPTEDVLIYKNF